MFWTLLACAPLADTWEGELRCDGYDVPLVIELTLDGRHYEGWGSLDCTALWGTDCMQSFELDVEQDGGLGAQELHAEIDNCALHTVDGVETLSCEDPHDLEWDGADEIDGEWGDCDVELNRG